MQYIAPLAVFYLIAVMTSAWAIGMAEGDDVLIERPLLVAFVTVGWPLMLVFAIIVMAPLSYGARLRRRDLEKAKRRGIT
jgi:hypothetical protein